MLLQRLSASSRALVRANSCSRVQHLSSMRVLYSFSDRVKDAIYALTPKILDPDPEEMVESEEQTQLVSGKYNRQFVITHGLSGPRTKLPPHLIQLIAPLAQPSDRFLALLRTDEVPVDVLLVLYRPILGTLTEECLVEFAVLLYKAGKYRNCLEVVTESMSFADGMGILSDMVIPRLLRDHVDAEEILITEMARGLIQIGQRSAASQLLQELDQDLLDECELQLSIQNSADAQDLNQFLFASQQVSLESFPSLRLSTQVSILKALLRQNNYQLFSNLFTSDFLSQEGVLRSMVRDTNNPALLDSVCQALQNSVSIYKHDLICIPQLGHSKKAFTKLWKAYYIYAQTPRRHKTKTLEAFLRQSIRLKESITSTSIIKQSSHYISDIDLLAQVVNQLMWAQERPSTQASDEVVVPETLKTELLERVARHTPKKAFKEATILAVKRINAQLGLTNLRLAMRHKTEAPPAQVFPGAPLWTLIMAQTKMSSELEQQLATSIASRPLLEQLRYYAVPTVTSDGIEQALYAHIDIMRYRAATTPKSQTDLNIKLILCGMVLMNREVTVSDAVSLDVAMVDLFASLNSNGLILLDAEMVKRVIKYMIYKQQFQAALGLCTLISSQKLCEFAPGNYEVPLKLYYKVLIESSLHEPHTSTRLFRQLKQQGKPIPSWVVRELAAGFAESPFLTPGQSTRRIVWMFRILRARGEVLGPDAVIAFVESILKRTSNGTGGTGGRQRLKWAIGLAKQEHVSEAYMEKWLKELGEMRSARKGYWRT